MLHFSRPKGRLFSCLFLAAMLFSFTTNTMAAQPNKTIVADTIYRADGSAASGTLVISWPAFATADGKPVAAGTKTVKIGPDGAVNIPLVPTQGATPSGTFYKVVFSLDDGTSSQEYWTVPTLSPTSIAAIRSSVVPATVAMQVVSREYVDSALANSVRKTGDETVNGIKTFASSPLVPSPSAPTAAANKDYVDVSVAAAASGNGGGTLDLSKGGTGQTSWTAARCVRVANDGSRLESAPGDCNANADMVDGMHATAFQTALGNAATLSKITESAGNPMWNGNAWPGGSGGSFSGNATQIMGKDIDTPDTAGQQLTYDGAKFAKQAKPYTDVRDYGAVCDGTTNDYAAIAAAIAAACPTSSCTKPVRVVGKCAYGTTLNVDGKANIIFEGGSHSATGFGAPPPDRLIYTGPVATNAISFRYTNGFAFRKLGLILRTTGQTGYGMDGSSIAGHADTNAFTIEDCFIGGDWSVSTAPGATDQSAALINMGGDGTGPSAGTILGTIRNCHLSWAQRGIWGNHGGYTNAIKVDDVLFDNLRVAGMSNPNGQGWTIINPKCEGTDGTSSPPTHGMPHCMLEENTWAGVSGGPMSVTGGWMGDAVNVPDAWIKLNGCAGCSFTGMQISNPYTDGILLVHGGKGITITGNAIGARYPIDLNDNNNIPGLTITGNTLAPQGSNTQINNFTCTQLSNGTMVTANGILGTPKRCISEQTEPYFTGLGLLNLAASAMGVEFTFPDASHGQLSYFNSIFSITNSGGTGASGTLNLNSGSGGTSLNAGGSVLVNSNSGNITLQNGGTGSIYLNPSGGKIVAQRQVQSTVTTGTAPLIVASTTEVANLRSATATALAAQYVDWNASTGGASIANKPALAGSKSCSGTDKVSAYDASTGLFTCTTDQTGGTGGGITNSAGSNVVMKSDGTNAVASSMTDSSGAVSGAATFDVSTGYRIGSAAATGHYLRGDGANYVDSTIQAADVPTLNQNTTGSAATLTTARAIYGNNFNGSAALTQIIASTYGGTGNGFTKFSGPTTTERTFTLPDASATVLTSNAAVTLAQGGTNQTSWTASRCVQVNAGGTALEAASAACGAGGGGITNSAGANAVMKSDGTNAVASTISDDGTSVVTTATGGIKSPLFKSATANPAASGVVRVANNECAVASRNAANGADICIAKINSSDVLELGGTSGGTLDIASGKTVTLSNTMTQTATDGSTVAFGAGGTVTYTVASGTSALGTGAIASAACATAVTTTATGTATTDVISWGFNGDPTGVTGYVPLTTGMLTIIAYPSANNVNFKVCNNTSASITPGAITMNWAVRR